MVETAVEAREQKPTQIWTTITILGVVVYIVIDIALAFLRSDYSLLRNAESDYGRGPYFWLMDSNFLLRCLLSLALVKALLATFPKNKRIRHASFWLALWAVTSGLLAFFADNPYGYPKLGSGAIHDILAVIAFVGAMVAMILFDRLTTRMKLNRISVYLLTCLTVLAFIALLLMGHAHKVSYARSLGGLYERIFLGSVLVWEAILALAIRTDGKIVTNNL